MTLSAPVLGPIGGPLVVHALAYADAGLAVFPVNPHTKAPMSEPTSQKHATTNPGLVADWWERWPDALIGHRLERLQLVTDIDPRHRGHETWKALKAEVGELPVTRTHASGRGDGGAHFWWQHPGVRLNIGGLNEWARQRELGHAIVLQDGTVTERWTAGIDLLHHDHRYTILPPSPHPDTGAPYRWVDGRGLQVAPAAMPELLVFLLSEPERPPAPAPLPTQPDSIADWFSATTTWASLLEPQGWQRAGGDGESDGSRWRHPSATSEVSATVKHGCLFVYCVDEATEALTERGWLTLDELQPGDRFLTLDPESRHITWQDATLNVFAAEERTLLRMTSKSFDALTTPDHRWLLEGSGQRGGHHSVRDQQPNHHFSTTAELAEQAKGRLIVGGGTMVDRPAPTYSDEFVELVGWVVTEGTYARVGYGIQVAQSATHNPQHVRRLQDLQTHFRDLGSTVSEYARTSEWGDQRSFYFGMGIAEAVRAVAPDKAITPEFVNSLTLDQANLLLHTLMAGDGHVDAHGTRKWTQKDPGRIDGFQMLCAIFGLRTHTYPSSRGCSVVTIYKAEHAHNENLTITEETYSGRVWCPTTPNGTWMARRNGFTFWTGNSPNTPFEPTDPGAPHGYTPFHAYAVLQHHGDQSAAARGARDLAGPAAPPLKRIDVHELVGGQAPVPGEVQPAPEVEVPHGPQPIDWSAFWVREHIGEDWLVHPILPRGRQVALWARHKTGKSLLTLEIAAALATGRGCLSQEAADPIDVIYLDMEMTEDDLHERLTSLGYGPTDALERLHYYLLPSLPPLDTPAGGAMLTNLAQLHGAQAVIIDTMARVVAGEENDADTYRSFYRCTGLPLKAMGVSVLRLDHGGKDATKGQRGSSGKGDDVDVVWQLRPVNGGLELVRDVARMSWVPDKVALQRTNGPLRHRITDGGEVWPAGTEEAAGRMRELGVTAETSQRDALSLYRGAGHEGRSDDLRKAWRWLQREEERSVDGLLEDDL